MLRFAIFTVVVVSVCMCMCVCMCAGQVTVAVMVCGWAHVLHAIYKPWGAGTAKYAIQHGSLFVTTFVFLMVRSCSGSVWASGFRRPHLFRATGLLLDLTTWL